MAGIYVIQGEGALVEMTEQAYASEDLLQEMLARYPQLLTGDARSDATGTWLLIDREIGIPGEEQGAERWSLDHLFLDHNAIPTLVEVKRSSDTRIRREVVGQLLDYAANAVSYWPVDSIRSRFEARCEAEGTDPSDLFAETFGPEADEGSYWQNVKTNLQAGRIRLVFVADVIPAELRRIVEFLNSQMDPAEVLALELRQFVGGELRTLVPRLIGQTAEAEKKKRGSSGSRRRWDEASFFQELADTRSLEETAAARRIYEWADERGLRPGWGTGSASGSFIPYLDTDDERSLSILVLWTTGQVGVRHGRIKTQRAPFDGREARQELIERLNGIPGVELPPEAIESESSFLLGALTDTESMTQFLAIMDWAYDQLEEAAD